MSSDASDADNALKNFFKRWPRFYAFLSWLVAPVLWIGPTGRAFAKSVPAGAAALNLGSGNTRFSLDWTNVDVFPFPEVDLLASGERLPFEDATFDAVACDMVLEHVPRPQGVVRELVRVAKPGARIYLAVPFLYPFHGSPNDFTRWSVPGLEALLGDGVEIERSGPLIGPTGAVCLVVAYWVSIVASFGISWLRVLIRYGVMALLSPLRILDALVGRLPGAADAAAGTYAIAKRR